MEDQQPDSGDLTTDAQTSEVAGSAATEVSTTVAQPEAATPQRRRRFSLRRKAKADEPRAPERVEESGAEVKPAARVPVGKKSRGKVAEFVEAESGEAEAGAAVDPAPESAPAPQTEPDPAPYDDAPQPLREVRFVPHRPAGKRLIGAAVAAAIAFVGAAAFAGATLQPYLAERAEVATKLDVARTAASAISTLWTYTPDNMESLPDRSAGFLGGDFAYEYRKYIDAIVAPNKQAQVTNTTQVLGAAVETLTPSEATALVYTNSVATSPVTKNIPSLRYLSYRLTMERRDADWLITGMSTVTSLDLTPQL